MLRYFIIIMMASALLPGCGGASPHQPVKQWGIQEYSSSDRRCTPLKPGETRFIDSYSINGSGIDVRYRLTATPTGYEALLNLKFGDAKRGRAGEKKMRKRAEECLAAVQPHLLGPANEKLSIRLATASDHSLPYPVEIQIAPEPQRSYSTWWSPDAGCETIVHEVLHLVGLVDEYREEEVAPCRSEGPWDSVMSDPDLAFKSNFGAFVDVECVCPDENDLECFKVLESLTGEPIKCPTPVSFRSFSGVELILSQEVRAMHERYRDGRLEGSRYRYVAQVVGYEKTSLLLPAQFRAITQPSCSESNPLYLKCVANAYNRSCSATDIPDECRGTSWLD